jgi:polyphosphate kinase
VPGLSDRIRVRSILGRFLEHSRIFRFGSESRGYRYYIGSADLVASKLDRRVEVVTPVECAALQDRLGEILDQSLRDDSQAWQLVDRTWTPIPTIDGVRAQEVLQALAVRASGPS